MFWWIWKYEWSKNPNNDKFRIVKPHLIDQLNDALTDLVITQKFGLRWLFDGLFTHLENHFSVDWN